MKNTINLLIISFFISSCATNKPLMSSVKPFDIQDFGLLKPSGNITVLAERNEIVLNEDLTTETNIKALYDLQQIFRWNNLKFSMIELEPEVQKEVDTEVYRIIEKINRGGTSQVDKTFSNGRANFTFQHIDISDELASVIQQNGKRFAVSVLNFGFVRTPNNEKKRNVENVGLIAASFAIAALTGVGVYAKNTPFSLSSYVIVIDVERKKLAYFQTKNSESDPTNDEQLKEQLHKLFDGYWLEYDMKSGRYQKIKGK
jgi:hypothetical protein